MLLLLAAVAAGCASSAPPAATTIDTEILQQSSAILEELFPASCRMVHKVHLRVRSRDALLTGHLVLDRRHGFRAVALDELGGPVFGFASCSGNHSVQKTPAKVREDIIVRGPVRDLELIFIPPASPAFSAELSGGLATLQWRADELVVARDFNLAARRLLRCREWQGRRLLRDISYHYGDQAGGGLRSVTVQNRALHYAMHIELLDTEATSPDGGGYDHEEWCRSQ